MRGSLVALLLVSSAASADDLPKPLPEKERAEIMHNWRAAYDAEIKRLKSEVADLTLKAKTDSGYKRALDAEATKLATMTKDPTSYSGLVFKTLGDSTEEGQTGRLAQSALTVASVEADGVVVEGTYRAEIGEAVRVVRYFLPNPPKGAKKGAKVTLSGLWYVAGEAERGGRKLPVLYAFEVKPDELPPPPKKK